MCGRYALAGDWSDFTKEFALDEVPLWTARYNIAPSFGPGFEAPILTTGNEPAFARFWYIPSWWTQPVKTLPTSFNARAETALGKAFFRGARPCLVPTTGWREFPGPPGKKRAFQFLKKRGAGETDDFTREEATGFFAFAGLWGTWVEPGTERLVSTFCILTTEPNEAVRRYHHRMPVLVEPSEYSRWLAGTNLEASLASCVEYCTHVELSSYECSTYGNHPGREGPACIEPVARQFSLF